MKKATRTIALVCALTMLVAALCGCSGGSPAETTPSQEVSSTGTPVAGGEITVGIAQDLDESLDPHSMVAAGTREVLFNVFEGLVKPDSEGNLIPAVASDYTVSESGDTFTFTLREGVQFHNGAQVTVGDVVYSISRAAGLDTGEPLMSELSSIVSVEATDDKTVVITTSEPSIEILASLTAAIIPEGSDPADGLIGTGPFQFVSRTPQVEFVLEKFDGYWGQGAYLDKVTYRIIESADTLVMSLKSGAIDLVAHLTAAQAAELTEFTVLEGTMNLVQALYLNNAVAPFDDVRVRQALCYAVNKQEIMDFIADGRGTALGSSIYPAFEKYFLPELADAYSQDIEKAKELLTEAGYGDGFTMTITVPSNYQPHIDTAEVLVQQLAAIGVTATIELVEWTSWLTDVYQGRNFQSTVVGFDAATMTARALLERWGSDASNNMINFSNAEYDETLAQALASTDDAEQTELYKRCETILSEEAANVYIQDLCDLVAMNPALGGYEFYPIYVMDMSTIYYMQ